MGTPVFVISSLLASVVAMTIFLSFNHYLFKRAVSPIVSDTKDVMNGTERIGRIRYHYYNEHIETNEISNIHVSIASKQCSDILLIGVGTAMSVEDYDKLAKSIVTKTRTSSLVVVISDSNPGHIVKLPSTKYASLSNSIRDQLNGGLIPLCTRRINEKSNNSRAVSPPEIGQVHELRRRQQQQGNVNFFIGGHSVGGQAALDAAQKGLYDFVPDGFVGLDPYDISENTIDFDSPLQFPTLSWGFTHTTCFVQVKKAAQGAYRLSSSDIGRVLYLINNEQNDMAHCVFTDDGCGVGIFDVCPTNENFEWVYESVAESIHLFVNALKADGFHFTKETFELPSTISGDVSLFVNSDDDDDIDRNSYIGGSDGRGFSEIIIDSADTSIEMGVDADGSRNGEVEATAIAVAIW